jgi:hypothetical protein
MVTQGSDGSNDSAKINDSLFLNFEITLLRHRRNFIGDEHFGLRYPAFPYWNGNSVMKMSRSYCMRPMRIGERASFPELWQQAGFPEGRDKEFELQAERELRNEQKADPTRTPE